MSLFLDHNGEIFEVTLSQLSHVTDTLRWGEIEDILSDISDNKQSCPPNPQCGVVHQREANKSMIAA